MKNLITRKEARELLGMSDATFRRRLKELNIQCISEILPNGIESKKIAYEDYIRLAESNGKKPIEKKTDDSSQELALYGIKIELVKAQLSLENALKSLDEKNEYIRKIEDKNDKLFDQLSREVESRMDTLSKINELQQQILNEHNKGFFARLFSR